MKRVIEGHRYDTDTAKKIGTDGYSNREARNLAGP